MHEFVERNKALILEAKKMFGGCYIAIIDMGEARLELELEVGPGEIAGNFTTDAHDLERARIQAAYLANEIRKQTECTVFIDRETWEKSWGE